MGLNHDIQLWVTTTTLLTTRTRSTQYIQLRVQSTRVLVHSTTYYLPTPSTTPASVISTRYIGRHTSRFKAFTYKRIQVVFCILDFSRHLGKKNGKLKNDEIIITSRVVVLIIIWWCCRKPVIWPCRNLCRFQYQAAERRASVRVVGLPNKSVKFIQPNKKKLFNDR